MLHLAAELWERNLEEMLRLSLELWDVLLGLPINTHITLSLKHRHMTPCVVPQLYLTLLQVPSELL